MLPFVVRRLLWSVVVLFLVVTTLFLVMRSIGGNPYAQYRDYIESVGRLDFGPSLSYRNRSVNDILREQGPVSLELGLLAVGWALVLGLPLGILGGLRPGHPADRAA